MKLITLVVDRKIVIKRYEPFADVKNFHLLYIDDILESLIYDNGEINYAIDLRGAAFVPKSGLLLCPFIEDLCKSSRVEAVLDIGTGYNCLLARHAVMSGAKRADAIDIDKAVIEYASKNTSHLSEKIHVSFGNNFSSITDCYDLIISNPAQMPSASGLDPNHDVSGIDGRENAEQILKYAVDYLNDGGRLLLLLFGFLGVNITTTSKKPSLLSLLPSNMVVERIKHYYVDVRENGGVYNSIQTVEALYPNYKFISVNGKMQNEIYVVQLKKV